METSRTDFQLSRRADCVVAICSGLLHLPAGYLIIAANPGLRLLPMLVLATVVGLAAVSGAVAASLSPVRRFSQPAASVALARSGVRAGVLSALLGAGMLVLGAKFHGLLAQAALWVPALLSILPGSLAGMLGAVANLRFGTSAAPAEDEITVTESGDSTELMVLIGAGALLGFCSPLISLPAPPPPAKTAPPPVAVPPPVAEKSVEAVPAPPAKPAFRFEPDKRLATATPDSWSLSLTKEFPDLETGTGFPIAMSRSGRLLAAVRTESNGRAIVITDLLSAGKEAEHQFDGRVSQIAFSPDEKSILCALEGQAQPFRVAGQGSSVKVLPIVEPPVVPATGMLWTEPAGVMLFRPASSETHSHPYDLETLLTETGNTAPHDALATLAATTDWRAGVRSAIVSADLPAATGTVSPWKMETKPAFAISDARENRRVFPEIGIEVGDRLLQSPDGSVLVRARDGSLTVFYFDWREPSPRRFTAALPKAPGQLPDDSPFGKEAGTRAMGVLVCAPLVNPLNGRTVGPDRSRILAVARCISWKDTVGEFEIMDRYADVSPQDVVADPHLWDAGSGNATLEDLGTPHRWWAPVGELSEGPEGAPPAGSPPLQELVRLAPTPSTVLVEAAPERPSAEENAPGPEPPGGENSLPVRITRFVLAHHAKATAGDVEGLVADYHETVEFFNKGTVPRDFVLAEERAYHSKLNVQETVLGRIRVTRRASDIHAVSYDLLSRMENRQDGAVSEVRTTVSLVLAESPSGLRIVSHNARK